MTTRYVQFSTALENSNLPPGSRWVATTLYSFIEHGSGDVSLARLAKVTGYNERTVQRHTRALRDAGWIITTQPRWGNSGKVKWARYKFTRKAWGGGDTTSDTQKATGRQKRPTDGTTKTTHDTKSLIQRDKREKTNARTGFASATAKKPKNQAWEFWSTLLADYGYPPPGKVSGYLHQYLTRIYDCPDGGEFLENRLAQFADDYPNRETCSLRWVLRLADDAPIPDDWTMKHAQK